MAQDLVGLFNLALSAVGHRARVSLPTENSREAKLCQLWYPVVRDDILSAAHWASARATANLALISSRDLNVAWAPGDPAPDWLYSFGLPSDLLYPRFINNYQQFELGIIGTNKVLYSNHQSTRLDYTKRQDNPALWEPLLYSAVADGLSAAVCMPLTGKAARTRLALELANRKILEARASNANKDTRMLEAIPDFLSVRGVSQPQAVSAYLYPFGPLLTLTSFVT